jgi:general secretion pathway protein D
LKAFVVESLQSILPSRFVNTGFHVIPNTNSFVALLSDTEWSEMNEFLAIVDQRPASIPVRLKYLNADQLMSYLPPSVGKENITQTGDPSLVFFSGPEAKAEVFFEELELLDKPVPQIRYDLLVIQYQHGDSETYGFSFDADLTEDGMTNAFLGSIGQLLNLNFNIVSTFGYMFALKLNLDIGASQAHVLADTTLNGLSGQALKFQNTNTYRYRDVEIDPDTGEQRGTGVTREITSGLIIDIEGWVSGDGMITMDVSATVSKQGANTTSGSSGSLPTTSEKIVNTHVRTPSGQPVVIGGLIQQDSEESVKKLPLLGDFPIVGKAFQQRTASIENTELAIYIVPFVEHPDFDNKSLDERLEYLYTRFVEPHER